MVFDIKMVLYLTIKVALNFNAMVLHKWVILITPIAL